jgi:hypothetical protein
MRRFWRRERRADWPEPRPEFLQTLSAEIREGRRRRRVPAMALRLAFLVVVAIAILVPSAFAGSSGKSPVRDAVKAVISTVQADSKATASRGNGKGKGKHKDDDDDDDDDDDNDDNGDYDDYDKKCPDFGKRRSALAHHQNQERAQLRAHQRSPHPGFSKKALRRHFKFERRMLHAHQKAEREQLKKECGKGRDHDDDDND